MGPENEPRGDGREELRWLYAWYKEEVFRRRERMMWLTAYASGIQALLLFAVLAVPEIVGAHKALCAAGPLSFAGVMAYLILQQRSRHLMAKQVLIEIERGLGLYETGRHREGAALYPEGWQTAWRDDFSVVIYLAALTGLAGLIGAAVFLR